MPSGQDGSPIRLAALLLGVLAAPPAFADDDFFYRVDAAELGCIIAHLDAYLASDADPVLVVPHDCPPEGGTDLAELITNEAPDLSFSEVGGIDPLLVLSPGHLRCLADVAVPSAGGVLRLYPDLCRVEPDRN
jgi:hypothetical protein